jgi:uncharacterized membrane protein
MQQLLIVFVSIWLIFFIGLFPGIVKEVQILKQRELTPEQALYHEKQLTNRLFIIILLALIIAIVYHPTISHQ